MSSLADAGNVVLIAWPTALATVSICSIARSGRDLLAQVAHEVLLAGDADEVRVGVAVADVVERVFVAELLVAGLQVDAGVVGFGAADVLVVVAVVHVYVGAPERVHHFDEAREVDVDDPVQVQPREDFVLDRFGREQRGSLRAADLGADRVRRVDLFVHVLLARGGRDVDFEVSRDRHHGRLALIGVEADQQDRVAVRGIAGVVDVLGFRAPVGSEHQEGLRAAAVFVGDEALRRFDVAHGREDLGGDAADRVQRDRGRGGSADEDDRQARDGET